jgi:hypothetical protein
MRLNSDEAYSVNRLALPNLALVQRPCRIATHKRGNRADRDLVDGGDLHNLRCASRAAMSAVRGTTAVATSALRYVLVT